MRIIADTNTLVSGFGWGGPPGQVVDTVLSGRVTLVISSALLGELARVLAYPKLAAIFDDPTALVAAVSEAADAVDPAERVTVLADEPDNRVLEAAAAGQADLIVTGDKAMLELGSFRGIPIVTAAQFVAQLQQQGQTEPPGPSAQTSLSGGHRQRSGRAALLRHLAHWTGLDRAVAAVVLAADAGPRPGRCWLTCVTVNATRVTSHVRVAVARVRSDLRDPSGICGVNADDMADIDGNRRRRGMGRPADYRGGEYRTSPSGSQSRTTLHLPP